jgi:hypothetical protein
MRPEPEHGPTERSQASVRIRISLAIRFDFLAPEFRIALGPSRVFGAPVPEAAVDENRKMSPGER